MCCLYVSSAPGKRGSHNWQQQQAIQQVQHWRKARGVLSHPAHLLATDRLWDEEIPVFSSALSAKPTRLQGIALNPGSHRLSYLNSVDRNRNRYEREKDVCREGSEINRSGRELREAGGMRGVSIRYVHCEIVKEALIIKITWCWSKINANIEFCICLEYSSTIKEWERCFHRNKTTHKTTIVYLNNSRGKDLVSNEIKSAQEMTSSGKD